MTPASLMTAMGHYAVTPALYLGSTVVIGSRLLGVSVPWNAVVATVLVGWAVYTIDRIKLADSFADPADLDSDAQRATRLRPISGRLRAASAAALSLAAWLFWIVSPLLLITPLAAVAFVWLYAGSPSGPSLKRRVIVKTPLVGLAVMLAGISPAIAPDLTGALVLPGLWRATLCLFLLTSADVAVCDLDHSSSDRAHGVLSLPVLLGSRAAGSVACVLIALATGIAWRGGAPWPTLAILGVSALGAMLAGRSSAAPSRHRDWVEWRLILAAALWV